MGPVPAENQLPAGLPGQQEPQRRIQPATARAFQPEEEMEYVELEDRRQREPLRQRRYLDEETPRDPYGSSDLEREPGGARFAPGQSGRSPDRELSPRANLGNGSVNAGPSWDRERQAEAWDPGDRDPGDRRSWERDLEERRPQDQGPAWGQSRDRDPAEGRPRDQEPGTRRSWDQEPEGRSWDQEPGDRRPSDQEPVERRSWDQEPEGRLRDRGEEGPSRRSRAAETPPLRRVDRAMAPELVDVAPEPVDVEPEILDDPW